MKRIKSGILASVVVCGGVVAAHAGDNAFITTTDFITGSSSVIAVDGGFTPTNNVAALHSDAVVRYHDGLFYVVNRSGADDIQVLDPANNFSTVIQYSVGAGSDPHDILIVSPSRAYVTRYNLDELLIVNPLTGAQLGTIDFGWLADASDGIPEMDYMARVGNHVFVTVQRLDRNNFYTPTDASYVAVIDVTTDQFVDADLGLPGTQAIRLTNPNPYSDIQLDPWGGRLYVSCVDYFGLADGGVEMINPYTLRTLGVMITEAEAGGDINDVELVSADKGYAIVADANFDTKLIRFNVPSGTHTGTLYTPAGYVLADIELAPFAPVCLLADRTPTNPGIRVWDTRTDVEITVNPIDVDLPPFDIAFNDVIPAAIDNTVPPVAYFGQAYPNPLRAGRATIPFTVERAGPVKLTVHDVLGRRVRLLEDATRGAGNHATSWDGRDDASRLVPSGVYFVRLEANDARSTRKIVVVR